MPLKRDVSPWRVRTIIYTLIYIYVYMYTCTYIQPPPTLKEFDEEQFIKMVEGAGPHMTAGIRGNWGPLYK